MKVILSPFPQYSEQAEVYSVKNGSQADSKVSNFSVHLPAGLLGLWVADSKVIVWLTDPVLNKGNCSREWILVPPLPHTPILSTLGISTNVMVWVQTRATKNEFAVCPSWLPVAAISAMTKINLGRRGFISAHRLPSIIEAKVERDLRQKL